MWHLASFLYLGMIIKETLFDIIQGGGREEEGMSGIKSDLVKRESPSVFLQRHIVTEGQKPCMSKSVTFQEINKQTHK